jgi:hypothetical protein
MNTLTLTLFLFAASSGAAHAAHHLKGHLSHHAWQANRSPASRTSPRTCSAVPGQQGRIKGCGEYVPSVYDPSPVSDY